jgi:hypothetical protein
MTKAELLDLLREAQPWIQVHAPIEATDLLMRIDAALAEEAKEQNPCRLIDVGDGGMSRERAEADAFRRGAEAMRTKAANAAQSQAMTTAGTKEMFAWCHSAQTLCDAIRAMPAPEDKS